MGNTAVGEVGQCCTSRTQTLRGNLSDEHALPVNASELGATAVGETGSPSSADAQPGEDSAPSASTGACPPELMAPRKTATCSSLEPNEKTSGRARTGLQDLDNEDTDEEEAEEEAAEEEDIGETRLVEIGNFMDVWSHSYQMWCHGVVQAVEKGMVSVVYQVPEHDAVLNTKRLARNSADMRVPLDDGPWRDAIVEVFSHSSDLWLPARIQEIAQGIAKVAFYYPDTPEGGSFAVKKLPLGDKNLRLPGADEFLQHPKYEVNGCVEVFSHSLAQWLPAVIQGMDRGCLKVAFYYPDMNPAEQEPMIKELPRESADVRPSHFVAGNPISIYSNSKQVWIEGTIKAVTQNGLLTVSFRYPGVDEQYEKELPIGHVDLRIPEAP